jgi:hypothetical protein
MEEIGHGIILRDELSICLEGLRKVTKKTLSG